MQEVDILMARKKGEQPPVEKQDIKSEALLQATRKALLYIKEYYPDCINFTPSESDVKSIALNIEHNGFLTIMYCYSHKFLLALLEYFKKIEAYEYCQKIVDAIETHNKLVGKQLPTSL